ncbi:MAG: hypothetical protein HN337_03585 [Deltaproteobacteria bacterium]|jgi:hypothetical protein|nr:hypothetical protein [Deltaproteobacteria bacterium]
MIYLRNTWVLLVMTLLVMFLHGCGGATPNTPTDIPVSLEGVDGTSGVAVDSSFSYEFDAAIITSTVTTSTYFMVPTAAVSADLTAEKSEFNTTICNADNAIDASVECESSTLCILDPTNDLDGGASYTACLTSGILYEATGDPITPRAFTFVTVGETFGVASVLDGAGVPIQLTGSTGVFPDELTINFTDELAEASDDTEVWGGKIGISCDVPGGSSLSSDPAYSGVGLSSSSILITVEETYRYQLMDCALSIASTLASVSGETLGSDIEYQFTTGCALNDDFNSDTQSCWEPDFNYSNLSWTTWPDILSNALTFDSEDSSVNYSLAELNKQFGFKKSVNVGNGDYSITVRLENVANFTSSTGTYGPDSLLFGIVDNDVATGYEIGFEGDGANRALRTARFSNGAIDEGVLAFCPPGTDYYFRLSNTNSTISAEYSLDNETWTEFSAGVMEYMDMIGEKDLLIFYRAGSNVETDTANIDYIRVEGMTSDYQY